ncbi:MAG: hypothetical protein AB7R89_33400, partial [Dehalococcoidia bacterium]
MTNDPQLNQAQADAIATTFEVMNAIAKTTLRDLRRDPPRHLADLYCLAHTAYAIGIRAARVPQLDRMVVASLAINNARIRQRLETAYTRQRIEPGAWCLSLNRFALQRHADPPTAT